MVKGKQLKQNVIPLNHFNVLDSPYSIFEMVVKFSISSSYKFLSMYFSINANSIWVSNSLIEPWAMFRYCLNSLLPFRAAPFYPVK